MHRITFVGSSHRLQNPFPRSHSNSKRQQATTNKAFCLQQITMSDNDDYEHDEDEDPDDEDDDDDSSGSDEEQDAEALRIAAQANKAVINRRTVDGSYEREWKNFKRWVDNMRRTHEIQEGEKYLTRLNVDLYFQQMIALKDTIEPKTARRVVAALQCMARQEEGLRFQIDNGAEGHVFQALQAQTQRYALRMLLQNDVDAHANLPTNSMDKKCY
jgi:hypothetical protein